jgi:hypothetical protein
MQQVSKQRIRKHAYNNRNIVGKMFSMLSMQGGYKEEFS